MLYTIKVTPEIIDRAERREGSACQTCVNALAIQEATGKQDLAVCRDTEEDEPMYVLEDWSKPMLSFNSQEVCDLPSIACDLAYRFDNHQKCEPIEYELEIPG